MRERSLGFGAAVRETLGTLRRPGPPPPKLAGLAAALIIGCLVAIVVLVWLGLAWHHDSHYYLKERKPGTYLSFLNLMATAAVSARLALHHRPASFARFWWITAIGFVWMACDDLFVFHERIDRGFHALFGLDPDNVITDHMDGIIVASYAVAAVAFAYPHLAELIQLRWMMLFLGVAFPIFGLMVVGDLGYLSKTWEDSAKLLSGALILVGFLAAWLQTKRSAQRVN